MGAFHVIGAERRSVLRFGALPALLLAACGGAVDLEGTEEVGTESQALQSVYRVRVQVITVESGFQNAMMTNALADANAEWQSAGIQFDFNPTTDVKNPSTPVSCSNDAQLGVEGDKVVGKIAVFYCPSRGGNASSGGPNSVAWSGDLSLGHEFGHYFHLDHTFRGGWVPEDRDRVGVAETYSSVESCIRAKLENRTLPAGCPNLSTGAAIRDFLLDGDGIADTPISLEIHPERATDPCGTTLRIPLVVHFTNGTTQDFGFNPARNNPLGYYKCSSIPRQLSATQIAIARESVLTGNRNHLIDKKLATWNTDFSDTNGWNQEKYYSTIRFANVNNSGGADVCGRGGGGITCAVSSGSSFKSTSVWNSSFSDANGWGAVQYYSTIGFPQIDNSGGADVCGRGSGGINCAVSNGSSFTNTSVWNSSFSDANGWNAEKYYSTIAYPEINNSGGADVCGRGSGGIYCATSNGSSFTSGAIWSTNFSDANGWGSAQHYKTIRFANVNGSGGADVCGRGTGGIYCGTSNGSSFTNVALWSGSFSDANGWTQVQYYSTIQFPDLNGDGKADVCARGNTGIVCGLSNGSSFGTIQTWSSTFSDGNGWNQAQYYKTLSFPDIDRDGKADVCGRGSDGVYCAYSTGSSFVELRKYSTSPNNASGWGQPQYYATLAFANIDSDSPLELCGRGVSGILCE
jgi:hypothetical protein